MPRSHAQLHSETTTQSTSKNDLLVLQDHQHPNNEFVPAKNHGTRGQQLVSDHQRYRKRGVPGKQGEEPETDMFNFVDIMLDMPEEPTWRFVIIKLFKVLAVMTVSYFALMALYFAAEFKAEDHMKELKVMVVDLDLGMVGTHYTNFAAVLNNQTTGQLFWEVQPKNRFNTLDHIKAHVESGACWGAVVIMPETSSTLNKMLSSPSADFDPTHAFAFVYDGGRDPLVVKPYIVANMYTTFLQFSKNFNPLWIKFVIGLYEQQGANLTAFSDAPHILGTPVAFTEYDLHPTTAPIITSATSVAYIWIFLVAGGSTYLVANMVQPLTTHASVTRTMASMFLPLFFFFVTLSMTYSILLVAFGVPFDGGASQFLLLFGGMLLLQLAVSSMVLFLIFLIPVVYIPMITITFVILNVIAVFNPVELMPSFYRWAYAMPFLNAVQIARYVLMGSYSRLHYNIPVLGAWIVIPWLVMPFAIARQKRLAREYALQAYEDENEQQQELYQLKQLHQRMQSQGSANTTIDNDNDDDNDDDDHANGDQVQHREASRQHDSSVRSANNRRSQEVAQTGGRVPRLSSTMTRGQHDVIHAPGGDGEDTIEDEYLGHHHHHHRRRQHHEKSKGTHDPNAEAMYEGTHSNMPYRHFYQPPPTPYILPPFQKNQDSASTSSSSNTISPPLNPLTVNFPPSAPTESQVFHTRSSQSSRIDVPVRRSSILLQQERYQNQQHQHPHHDRYSSEPITYEAK
ncbi:hypothetical protein BGZ94_001788 [Podila epigama]|nr:hypothetical protein BGZ94_001788 [Podila epigama]